MTLLPKTMQKSDLQETNPVIYHSKALDKSIQNCNFYRIRVTVPKRYGYVNEILVYFTTTTHQVWLNHVTHVAKFEN